MSPDLVDLIVTNRRKNETFYSHIDHRIGLLFDTTDVFVIRLSALSPNIYWQSVLAANSKAAPF